MRVGIKRLLFIVIVLALLIITVFIVTFYFDNNHSDELILYGNVDVRQVDISFRVAGKVNRLFFEEGDWVEEGQLMAELEQTPYISQVAQAEAALYSNRALLANGEKLLKRRNELIEVEGVSEEDFENAQTNQKSYQANVSSSEAALTIAQDNLSYTRAYAPTCGIVLTRIREPGSVVNPTDPVYTLSINRPIWVRAYVSEPDLGKICFGMPATIYTDNRGGPTYQGKIGFISPMAEFTPKTVETAQLRTDLVYRLRIYIDQADCRLKQGMPVTVKLKLNHT